MDHCISIGFDNYDQYVIMNCLKVDEVDKFVL